MGSVIWLEHSPCYSDSGYFKHGCDSWKTWTYSLPSLLAVPPTQVAVVPIVSKPVDLLLCYSTCSEHLKILVCAYLATRGDLLFTDCFKNTAGRNTLHTLAVSSSFWRLPPTGHCLLSFCPLSHSCSYLKAPATGAHSLMPKHSLSIPWTLVVV